MKQKLKRCKRLEASRLCFVHARVAVRSNDRVGHDLVAEWAMRECDAAERVSVSLCIKFSRHQWHRKDWLERPGYVSRSLRLRSFLLRSFLFLVGLGDRNNWFIVRLVVVGLPFGIVDCRHDGVHRFVADNDDAGAKWAPWSRAPSESPRPSRRTPPPLAGRRPVRPDISAVT